MRRTIIIGVGSPQGDDRVGWTAVQRLANRADLRALGDALVLELLDRPGATLIGRWRGAQRVVLIDAVRSGAPAGTLHRLGSGDLCSSEGLTTSHGFGMSETIRLAAALGVLPDHLVILGIESRSGESQGEELSPEVLRALPDLVEAVVREVIGDSDSWSAPATQFNGLDGRVDS